MNANLNKLTILSIFLILLTSSLTQAQQTEDFESFSDDDITFNSNGQSFTLDGFLKITGVSRIGYNLSDFVISNFDNCADISRGTVIGSISTTDNSPFFINTAYIYTSTDCGPTLSTDTITVQTYRNDILVRNFDIIVESGVEPHNSGFKLINFHEIGSACDTIDKIKFTSASEINYMSIDQLVWSKVSDWDYSISSLSSNQNNICPQTTVELEASATYNDFDTLKWYTGSNRTGVKFSSINNVSIQPNETATYYASIDPVCGGDYIEESVEVTVLDTANVDSVFYNYNTLCQNESAVINVVGTTGDNGVVTWYDAPNATGNLITSGDTITVTPTDDIHYYANVVSTCNSQEVSLQITVNDNIASSVDNLVSDANDVCGDDDTKISFNNVSLGTNASYTWSDSEGNNLGTIDTITVSPNVPTTYYLNISSDCQTVTDSLELNVYTTETEISVTGATATASLSEGVSYTWINCDDNSTVGSSQSLTATENGNYKVEITNNSCVEESICVAVAVSGIDNKFFNETEAYPNPTSNVINLISSDNFHYSVLNQSGIALLNGSSDNNSKQLDLSNIPDGIYTIEISNNSSKKSFKVVKQ